MPSSQLQDRFILSFLFCFCVATSLSSSSSQLLGQSAPRLPASSIPAAPIGVVGSSLVLSGVATRCVGMAGGLRVGGLRVMVLRGGAEGGTDGAEGAKEADLAGAGDEAAGESGSQNATNATEVAATNEAEAIDNITYGELMENFGISKDYLDKMRKDADQLMKKDVKPQVSKVILGLTKPQWEINFEERVANGTYAPLSCIRGTSVPYAQPTGLWRPGDDPDDPKFKSAGPEADGFNEAAQSSFSPHNYKTITPREYMAQVYPQVMGEKQMSWEKL